MHAILVHGMGRTPASMLVLAYRLRRLGIRPRLFGYSATVESFAAIAGRLTRQLRSHGSGPYIGIGHSLGGLLLRAAVADLSRDDRSPDHLFLLGTPNRSPRLARRLRDRWLFRLVHGDCGQMLADPSRMEAIPTPVVPMTLVAGTTGWTGRRSPFGDEPNDGVVTVSEVGLDGHDPVPIPLPHTFVMNGRRVADVIRRAVVPSST
jgi:hypothetical protein